MPLVTRLLPGAERRAAWLEEKLCLDFLRSGCNGKTHVGQYAGERKPVRKVKLMLLAWVAMLMAVGAQAQTTGTNMVNLISDNVTNARDELVPLGIGLTVLFIAIAIGVKIYRKTVK